jgi:hypothetical protein
MKRHFLQIGPAVLALVFLAGCENIEFNYGRPNCKNVEPSVWTLSVNKENLDSYSIYSSSSLGRSTVSMFQAFNDVCPGDSVTFEIRAVWESSSLMPAYFGAVIHYHAEVLENIPLTFTYENNLEIVTGKVTAIAPTGETDTDFSAVFEVLFLTEDKFAALNIFKSSLISLDMTFRYSKLIGNNSL